MEDGSARDGRKRKFSAIDDVPLLFEKLRENVDALIQEKNTGNKVAPQISFRNALVVNAFARQG